MRYRSEVLALAILLTFSHTAVADDPTDTERVNKLMSGFDTPRLSPGQSGTFSFNLTNPNENAMTNISLTMSIYMFATEGQTQTVDNSWETPYIENNLEQEFTLPMFDLDALPEENSRRSAVTVVTSADTPQGSPGAYFVRFRMEFDYVNESGAGSYVMASRGYFTDQMWEDATNDTNLQNCDDVDRKGDLCLTYLGVDGIIPDSSFSVSEAPVDAYFVIDFWILMGIVGSTTILIVVALILVISKRHRPPPLDGRES